MPSRKLTWQWKITISNRRYIFKWLFFHRHVSFGGCRWDFLGNKRRTTRDMTFKMNPLQNIQIHPVNEHVRQEINIIPRGNTCTVQMVAIQLSSFIWSILIHWCYDQLAWRQQYLFILCIRIELTNKVATGDLQTDPEFQK